MHHMGTQILVYQFKIWPKTALQIFTPPVVFAPSVFTFQLTKHSIIFKEASHENTVK